MKTALALAASLAVRRRRRAGGALVVKASPTTSPCAAAAAEAFRRATGSAVEVQTATIGPVGSAAGADVVVAIEEELTRVIEGGESAPDLEVDVATIPWVLTGAGTGNAGPARPRPLGRARAGPRRGDRPARPSEPRERCRPIVRAATLARSCRVEGGYARPIMPRWRLRSPDHAALRAATLARSCRVEGGYARPIMPR